LEADSGRTIGEVSGSIGASGTSAGSSGVKITQIIADGPAAQAGLRIGDIITGLDGMPVRTAQILDAEISLQSPGSKIRISYLRDSRQAEATVFVGKHTKR
jgi:S1-C subfamily serine protease